VYPTPDSRSCGGSPQIACIDLQTMVLLGLMLIPFIEAQQVPESFRAPVAHGRFLLATTVSHGSISAIACSPCRNGIKSGDQGGALFLRPGCLKSLANHALIKTAAVSRRLFFLCSLKRVVLLTRLQLRSQSRGSMQC